MSQKLLSPHEIERWSPPSLQYVVGCSKLKEHFRKMLEANGLGPNLLITGDSGTGKTASVGAYLRAVMCPDRNPSTFDACGQCQSCKQFDPFHPMLWLTAHLFVRIPAGKKTISYFPIDCRSFGKNRLSQFLPKLKTPNPEEMTIVYLDSLHSLQQRGDGLVEMVAAYLDEPNTMCIATAPSASHLSPRLLREFPVVLSTSPASHEDFVQFLQQRCKDWGLNLDSPETLVLLAQRSNLNPRVAIEFLATVARQRDRARTRNPLEHQFPADDTDGEQSGPGAGPSEPIE